MSRANRVGHLGARKPPAVLIAEDGRVGQLIMRRMCESLGYRAVIVANGELALRALLSEPYDAAFLDCYMPMMNASDVLAIYRRVACHRTPIAIVSAEHAPELTYGAQLRLNKPVTVAQFREFVTLCARKAQRPMERRTTAGE